MSKHLASQSLKARCLDNAAQVHRKRLGQAFGRSWEMVPPKPHAGRHRVPDEPADALLGLEDRTEDLLLSRWDVLDGVGQRGIS